MNRLEELVLRILRHWLTYYVLAWLVAVVASVLALHYAWVAFDTGLRRDGNSGHATIDFGGQYLMGRMLVTGHGRDLYNRFVHRQVLSEVYVAEDWEPLERKSTEPDPRGDVENLMWWTMGRDDSEARETVAACAALAPGGAGGPWHAVAYVLARDNDLSAERIERASRRSVGGPLYPPVNAFFLAPLALMEPHTAYRVQQCLNLALVFVAAAGASWLTRGRVWCPVLAVAIMVFPGFAGSINLGQNATLTLAILVWGWALAARGRPALGGMVWGLLAFKPVWALAFFLVPFLSRRWRMCAAMIAGGAGIALITLPFVGLQAWRDWLSIGKEAADLYDIEKNWIFLSRDLLSVPRRFLLDFDRPLGERLDGTFWLFDQWQIPLWFAAQLFGWAMVLFALEATVRLVVLRRQQVIAPDGPPAAFLCLGAWMSCYHFMYYDVLLGALGLFLLFTEPRRYLSPLLVLLGRLRNDEAGPRHVAYHRAGLPDAVVPPLPLQIAPRAVWTLNRMAPTAFALLLIAHYIFPSLGLGSQWGTPWDTFILTGVWAWCGWQWLRHGEKIAVSWDDTEPSPSVAAAPANNGEGASMPKEGAVSVLPTGETA
jgi:hypothetical protein